MCDTELSHVEMISAIVYQLTRDLSIDEIKKSGFDTYFVDHTTGIYPIAASGVPFSASTFQVCGDILTDLTEDMAAEGAAWSGQLFAPKIARFKETPHFCSFGKSQTKRTAGHPAVLVSNLSVIRYSAVHQLPRSAP
ncbi:MAG: manganese catalase family protein [Oscillospiraceae bacterium]